MKSAITKALAVERERYGKTDLARVALQAIPFVGAPLDLLLTEGSRRLAEQRVAYMIAGLEADVQRLDEAKVDHEYLKSRDFEDLLWAALALSARSRENEKIRFNARVLSGAIQVGSRGPDLGEDPHFLMSLLADRDADDLRILRAFIVTQHETPRGADQSQADWAIEQTSKTILVRHLKGMRTDDFGFRLGRLMGAGYIKEIPTEPNPRPDGLRAFVLDNVMHRLASWLNRYGGFPEPDGRAGD